MRDKNLGAQDGMGHSKQQEATYGSTSRVAQVNQLHDTPRQAWAAGPAGSQQAWGQRDLPAKPRETCLGPAKEGDQRQIFSEERWDHKQLVALYHTRTTTTPVA